MIGVFSTQKQNRVQSSSGSGASTSMSGGSYSTATKHAISFATVEIKCSGNSFVRVGFVPYGDGSTSSGFAGQVRVRNSIADAYSNIDSINRIYFHRGATVLGAHGLRCRTTQPASAGYTSAVDFRYPASTIFFLDRPSAGTHTYTAHWYHDELNAPSAQYNLLEFNYCYFEAVEWSF